MDHGHPAERRHGQAVDRRQSRPSVEAAELERLVGHFQVGGGGP
ncbi:hypothetical protein ACRAWD_10200 [Caulobacter segnis]